MRLSSSVGATRRGVGCRGDDLRLCAAGLRGIMAFGLSSKIANCDWRKRLAVYVFMYFIYVLLHILIAPLVMRFIDTNYPGVFFYHLKPDKHPGPLGDPSAFLLSVFIDYIFFVVFFVPIALKTKMPIVLIVILGVLNEPIIFVCLIG
jgi:uncharacterized membrane protein YhaH (DUF805 family)